MLCPKFTFVQKKLHGHVIQNASVTVAFRAASASASIWVTTSLTRRSASCWLSPVRAATTFGGVFAVGGLEDFAW